MPDRASTALPACALLAGWAAVEASGSRAVGGIVLLAGGAACAAVWRSRHGARRALELSSVLLAGFVLSHVIGLVLGAWPAVLVTALLTAAAVRARLAARPAPARAQPALPKRS